MQLRSNQYKLAQVWQSHGDPVMNGIYLRGHANPQEIIVIPGQDLQPVLIHSRHVLVAVRDFQGQRQQELGDRRPTRGCSTNHKR